ncbi:DNA repair protein [Ferroplasma acidiphilum]|uniref:DNA double-strand break repair protein Mre11 n=1 Tax=Ferroplasma acidiphilum TaxID=74969 RepID=A0A1V0N5J3_9ARCH|nr:exonuclease SbcCD subunit D [Ferroplasma acidiphilum]ARD85412.1 DNA repair protein [Ferroplasma acidiphilum]
MARFLHLSDTHLGYRQYMMDLREEDFYESFNEAIDFGLEENVDFFVHTGDLFDTWSPSNRAMNEFKKAMIKLYKKNKTMYLIMGDHDRPKRTDEVASRIFDFLGVKLLGTEELQSIVINYGGEDILLSGISNMKGLRKNNLVEQYRKADVEAKSYKNSIMMSHQGVSPYLIPEACEVDSKDLPVNYKYLAFGHVHDSYLITDKYPVFSYAGSTDLNSTNEIKNFLRNGKSVNLVDIENGKIDAQRVKLKSTRYLNAVNTNYASYMDDMQKILKTPGINGKEPLISLTIHGDADRDDVKANLLLLKNVIIRGPVFEKEVKSIEEKPNMSKLQDYFKAYFKDDQMASLAENIFNSIKNEDNETSYRLIREIMQVE